MEIGDRMLSQLRNYVEDNTFRFTIYEDKIHIINFQRIITLEDNYISFTTKQKRINIIGENLSLKKILQTEILLFGKIAKIEVKDE